MDKFGSLKLQGNQSWGTATLSEFYLHELFQVLIVSIREKSVHTSNRGEEKEPF